MRKLFIPLVAVAALAVGAAPATPASTATATVQIKRSSFVPRIVTIKTGDSVKWTNNDTKTHQVVSNSGAFASPIIAAGKSYTHMFNTAGTYRYHDALHPALTGKVVVTGPPPAVTIGAGAPIIVYGQATHVSGQISSGAAGETVTVYSQPYGAPSATLIATLMTGTGGVWDAVVAPTLLTTYQAHWKSTTSADVMVAVHPRVRFTLRRGHGAVRVVAARSMAGRKVYIQRFTRFHEWVKIRRVILGSTSARSFRLKLPRGRYVLRAYITVNQAGPGYLDGASRNILYRVR